jgi:hypothetical protein
VLDTLVGLLEELELMVMAEEVLEEETSLLVVLAVLTMVQGLLVLLLEVLEIVPKHREVLEVMGMLPKALVQYLLREVRVEVLEVEAVMLFHTDTLQLQASFLRHSRLFGIMELEAAVEVRRVVMGVIYLYTSVKL